MKPLGVVGSIPAAKNILLVIYSTVFRLQCFVVGNAVRSDNVPTTVSVFRKFFFTEFTVLGVHFQDGKLAAGLHVISQGKVPGFLQSFPVRFRFRLYSGTRYNFVPASQAVGHQVFQFFSCGTWVQAHKGHDFTAGNVIGPFHHFPVVQRQAFHQASNG